MPRRRRIRAAILFVSTLVCLIALVASPKVLRGVPRDSILVGRIRAWSHGAKFVGREGVSLQRRSNDCGAACLKMVLESKEVPHDLEELTKLARTNGPGTSLFDLRRVATSVGVRGRSWHLNVEDLATAPFPVIAHVRGNHFVVVQGQPTPGMLQVDDPALGRLLWPIREFALEWSGDTLVFDPSWRPPRLSAFPTSYEETISLAKGE